MEEGGWGRGWVEAWVGYGGEGGCREGKGMVVIGWEWVINIEGFGVRD